MTPETFIARWKNNDLTERAGAQAHFDDLCDLLGVDKPRDPENYCFERGAKKAGGGDGWADVWKRGHFGWENKKPGRDLKAALRQLTDYALNLDNPPLLIVCDRENIEIHTAFTGYPDEVTYIRLEDLTFDAAREKLRWAFEEPERLRPKKSSAAITGEAAGRFSELAEAMRERGLDGQKVAHFLMQCLFCMFAEDEDLLPKGIFTRLLEKAGEDAARAAGRIGRLFSAMREKGGVYGDDDIQWFNGGLFEQIDIPALTASDLVALAAAAKMDWRGIDPSIFGTLFERGLDPKKRAQLGAHYTDAATIEKLVSPLVSAPLTREWEAARKAVEKLAPKFDHAQKRQSGAALKQGRDLLNAFLLRLENFRVLDPACGSGNFLYLSLAALREVEKRARRDAAELGLRPSDSILFLHTGPHNILGLEVNEFAAELARVTVWIGDIQWSRRNGYPPPTNPVLRSLAGIEQRDALLAPDGSEAAWPAADVVVGNPPFLGGSKKRRELGDDYFDALNRVYEPNVPGGADLVCYWFEKARKQILAGQLQAAGLVATNSIRGGTNRKVLEAVVADFTIFEAWRDEAWVNDGAAVRVSLVAFDDQRTEDGRQKTEKACCLDGSVVATIHADLTAGEGLDLSRARPLSENVLCSFQGSQKIGAFDIPGELAREWLTQPNPNGRPNSDVVKPSWNGIDQTRRPRDGWIVDFGTTMTEENAALYEKPFEYVERHVKPERIQNPRPARARYWWRHGDPQPAMRAALEGLPRYIATAHVSKHRLFVWMNGRILPDKMLIVVARDDDMTFGILSSRFHELWSLRLGTSLEDRPRYTPTTCFETFPFPEGMTPREIAIVGGASSAPALRQEQDAPGTTIAAAARELDTLRNHWLNPPEWVDWVITSEEEAAGFPKRPVAKPGFEAELKKRTLTNLYNARPAWLALVHEKLDAAVAAAYGWQDYTPKMPDEEILRRLLALNSRRAAPREARPAPAKPGAPRLRAEGKTKRQKKTEDSRIDALGEEKEAT
ncbi:MAG: N-6 DNA methylase [Zoogloeaceae bacterium]|jgi:type II restriction/modification system DNA methylase subunit YeeA|nr:N-6 DNA methylase [Zoogloeaceae bacterium]